MEKYRTLKFPPSVFWEVTEQCNHNCLHCFNYWRTDLCTTKNTCPDDFLCVAKKIVEINPVRVTITGGEPFVVFDMIKPALQYLIKNNISISFNTNIALLNEEIAGFLFENKIPLFVSFPSSNPSEFDKIVDKVGAFDKVSNSLEMAKRYGLMYQFNMVVSKINLHSVYDTANYLKEQFGIKELRVTRVSMPLNAREHFDQFMLDFDDLAFLLDMCVKVKKQLNISIKAASPVTPCSTSTQEAFDLFAFENSCEAGKSSFVISSNNTIRACARDSKEYGDLFLEPFSKIWERMEEWRDDSFVPDECSECKHKSFCRGGCRVDSIINNGHRKGLDCYSNEKAASIDFVKRPPFSPCWDYETAFFIPNDLSFCNESFGVRVSLKGQYLYCTENYAEFLKANVGSIIKMADFCQHFGVDLNTAIHVLDFIVSKGIIKKYN